MALVEYEVTNRVGIIRLNRPERLNAFSVELRMEFEAVFAKFAKDDDAWVGVLTGNGRAFSAGRDLKEEVNRGAHHVLAVDGREPNPFYTVETDKPVIAAVNGYAIGAGFYIVLGCDLRIAADSAIFGMGEIPTGVLGPYWLSASESIPWAIANELAFLGENISAQRAFDLRLVNQVVPAAELMPAALALADKLVHLPPLHLRRTKALMRAMRGVPSDALLKEEHETRAFLNALEDTREAGAAFVERRPAVFHGR